ADPTSATWLLDLLVAMASGGALFLPAPEASVSPAAITSMLERDEITHLLAPPAVLALLDPQALSHVRTIGLVADTGGAGEALESAVAPTWSRGRKLGRRYTPAASLPAALATHDTSEIYRPLANGALHVLADDGMPAPIGVIGEL